MNAFALILRVILAVMVAAFCAALATIPVGLLMHLMFDLSPVVVGGALFVIFLVVSLRPSRRKFSLGDKEKPLFRSNYIANFETWRHGDGRDDIFIKD